MKVLRRRIMARKKNKPKEFDLNNCEIVFSTSTLGLMGMALNESVDDEGRAGELVEVGDSLTDDVMLE
jgi:hypothetical protein